MQSVQVGETYALLPEQIIELARQRCLLESFLPEAVGREEWRVELCADRSLLATEATDAAGSTLRMDLKGRELRVEVPRTPLAAELILRLLFHLEVARKGGLLLHSSGISFSGGAVVATGPSGAGKSTFAEFCTLDPDARLLSDEIVAVFPNGICLGTPFRSSLTRSGSPGPAPLKSILTLVKGSVERIDSKPPDRAVAELMKQVYRSSVEPLPNLEIFRRVSLLVEKVGVRELTFRKHPSVAGFIRDWLAG